MFTRTTTTLFKCKLTTLHLTKRSFSANMPEKQIKLNNQTINYLQVGNGNKHLLCFPGALGSIWSDFKPQIEGLDRHQFTITAWDPPGYGLSRPANRKFTKNFYKDDADFALELMQKLGINKFSLLGWSDGGISSMILAAKYPDNVENLVIWGANAYVLPKEIAMYEKIRDIQKWSERARAPLVKLYTEKGFQDMWNQWCDVLLEIQKEGGDICKKELPKIKCKTLILHGDKDPMIAAEHPDFLAANIRGSRLHRFPEGKHNIHLRYADEFNKLISEFILTKSKM